MYLAWAECCPDVPGTGVAGVVSPPVQVLHHPVQPPPKVVLGPPAPHRCVSIRIRSRI